MIDRRKVNLSEYYLTPGPMTDPRECAGLLQGLPTDAAGLRDVTQGLMVHIFWAKRLGLELTEQRQQEVQLRHVSQKLARIMDLDPRSLSEARQLERRLVGNCRDFTVLFVTLLRAQGIPARSRCGFGTYFMPGHFEDHWVADVYDREQARWVMMDPQLDAFMLEALDIQFDPLALPAGAFITGAQAWKMCRAGQADPDLFGIFEYKGWDFVRGNLLRDLLAVNRVEVLPWDFWGMLTQPLSQSSAEVWAVCDRLAEALLEPDDATTAARELYTQDTALHPPEEWLIA